MRQPGTLPVILSREDVQRVIAHTSNLKHRTMLLATYAAGLRLNEAAMHIPRFHSLGEDDGHFYAVAYV
jgi:site-specific recombinase XerD